MVIEFVKLFHHVFIIFLFLHPFHLQSVVKNGHSVSGLIRILSQLKKKLNN